MSGLLGLGLVATTAAGQTRFSWPDTAVDFTHYTHVEECGAAANRTWRALTTRRAIDSGIWWDTMPFFPQTADTEFYVDRSTPAVLEVPATRAAFQAAAQRCARRFARLDSVPVKLDTLLGQKQLPPTFARYFRGYEAFYPYGMLFADAGDSTTLIAYLDRRLQGASPEEVARTLVSAAAVLRYITPPTKHRLYAQLVDRYAPRIPDRVLRAQFYATLLLDDVHARRDTASALGVARRLARFVTDSLTPPQRDSFYAGQSSLLSRSPYGLRVREGESQDLWPGGSRIPSTLPWPEHTLTDWLHYWTDLTFDRDKGMDSLRKSTDAYANFVASRYFPDFKSFAQLDSASKAMWDRLGFGRKVPPLNAMTWAGPTVTGPRPTPGKVSLVVFFNPRNICGAGAAIDNGEETAGNCAERLIYLRRFIDSFPGVEVTLATRAFGFFRTEADSLTPAKEAALVYQMLAAMKITTVPVAIVDPGHRSLPEPDGRPVESATADSNFMAYARGASKAFKPEIGITMTAGLYEGTVDLIDPDGRVVYEGDGVLDRRFWPEVASRARALLDRKRTGP